MEVLNYGLVALCAVAALAALVLRSRGREKSEVDQPVAAARHAGIAVRGWREAELTRLCADFAKSYDLKRFPIATEPLDNGCLAIRFPHGIPAHVLEYLVNYIHYPKRLDPTGRDIIALGRRWIEQGKSQPGGPAQAEFVTYYVPEDDHEYDVVYARTDTGNVFAVSFAAEAWERVSAARFPRRAEVVDPLARSLVTAPASTF